MNNMGRQTITTQTTPLSNRLLAGRPGISRILLNAIAVYQSGRTAGNRGVGNR